MQDLIAKLIEAEDIFPLLDSAVLMNNESNFLMDSVRLKKTLSTLQTSKACHRRSTG